MEGSRGSGRDWLSLVPYLHPWDNAIIEIVKDREADS